MALRIGLVEHQSIFIPIWPLVTGYLGTRGMLQIVKSIAENHGLHTPLLIAHPEHIERCFFIARKIFGTVATDHGAQERRVLEEWFDQHSVQKWTTSPGRWLLYKMLARIHHRLYGWM